jgi:hypothetical protein
MNPYVFLALDLARERTNEADRNRLAALATIGRPSWTRRVLARAFALNSMASASIARRLDACIADDLTRSLVSAD